MDLMIIDAVNESDEEYVELEALTDLNLENFMIRDETFDEEGNPSNKHPHVFFFPYREINRGDKVRIYTNGVRNSRRLLPTGKTLHIFNWGIDSGVWNDSPGDMVQLYRIRQEDTHRVQ